MPSTTTKDKIQSACFSSATTSFAKQILVVLLIGWSLLFSATYAASAQATPQISGSQLMEQGLVEFNQGQFGSAVSSYTSAAKWFRQQKNTTEQCEALIATGQANYFIGKHHKALETLQSALVLLTR